MTGAIINVVVASGAVVNRNYTSATNLDFEKDMAGSA